MQYQDVREVIESMLQTTESDMNNSPQSTGRFHETLSERFGDRLRVIARQSITYWFNHDKLDKLLAQYVGSLEGCELIYAIDQSGRQVSSNIYSGSIDSRALGQDLSNRPYTISISVLRDVSLQGAFACDAYVSQTTQRPCVTVMYGVTSGSSLMGFIAADFYPSDDEVTE